MKFSQRIKLLVGYIKQDSVLYDLCCDHGNFGILAHKQNKSREIHFVDSVPSIIQRLEVKVEPHIADDVDVIFKAEDARKIVVKDNASIILAGVGDHLGAEILSELIDPTKKHRWIISLQKFNVQTRKILNQFPVKIIADTLFKEKSRYRELIVVETASDDDARVPLIPHYVSNPQTDDEKVYSKLFNEFI